MVKENPDALAAGFELDGSRYKIKKLLGWGSFGITYIAYDAALKREVAIKEFFPNAYAQRDSHGEIKCKSNYKTEYDACWEDFQNEDEALSRCKHVGVVRKFDDFEENHTDYLVMEFIRGEQLGNWVEQNNTDLISHVLPLLLDALEFIHDLDLVHRDLKPANIIVREGDNQPVLIDFGSIRLDYDRNDPSTLISTTKRFAAPELISKNLGNATPASDLYALGVILYEHVTGSPPAASFERNMNDELVSVGENVKPVFAKHTGLLEAIDASLIMAPENRLQSISDFRNLLITTQKQYIDSISSDHSSGGDSISVEDELQGTVLLEPELPETNPPNTEHNSFPLKKLLILGLIVMISGATWSYNLETVKNISLAKVTISDQTEKKTIRLAKLEKLTRNAISKRYYSKPKGKSAVDYIEKMRAIAPDDVRISELAALVVTGYLNLAKAKLPSSLSKASHYVGLAHKIMLQYKLTQETSGAVKKMRERLNLAIKAKNTLANIDSKMVVIHGGEFRMGNRLWDDSMPEHRVHMNSFKMGKYEVTQALWKAVMDSNPSAQKGDALPVTGVSWNNIEVFMKKLNKQTGLRFNLPSEAEWEYAARAGRNKNWHWGDRTHSVDSVAWYEKNASKHLHPVGQKKPNDFGLYDMHGNVWEWVEDCWNSNYKDAPTDGSAWRYGKCGERVLRGGSYNNSPVTLLPTYRNHDSVDKKYINIGFRIVQHLSSAEIILAERKASEKKIIQVAGLEKLARDAISKIHYSVPKEDSALDYIEQIRAIAPDKKIIHKLAFSVALGYLKLAETHAPLNRTKASHYLAQARKVSATYGLDLERYDGIFARFQLVTNKLVRKPESGRDNKKKLIRNPESNNKVHSSVKERQKASCDATTIDFKINGDGTVTDKITGLMWKQCSEGLSGLSCEKGSKKEFTASDVEQYAKELNAAGGFASYKDWRLPSVTELKSIWQEHCESSINGVVFANTEATYGHSVYWSWNNSRKGSFFYHPMNRLLGRDPMGDLASFYFSGGNNYMNSHDGFQHHNNVRLVRGGE